MSMMALDTRRLDLPLLQRVERIREESPDLFEALAQDSPELIKDD